MAKFNLHIIIKICNNTAKFISLQISLALTPLFGENWWCDAARLSDSSLSKGLVRLVSWRGPAVTLVLKLRPGTNASLLRRPGTAIHPVATSRNPTPLWVSLCSIKRRGKGKSRKLEESGTRAKQTNSFHHLISKLCHGMG